MASVWRHDLDSVTVVSELGRAVIPPSGSMLKFDVASDIATTFHCYTIGRGKGKFFSLAFASSEQSRCEAIGWISPYCGGESYSQFSKSRSRKVSPTEMFRVVRTYPNTVVLSGFKRDDQSNWPVSCFPVERYSIPRVPSTR